MGSVEIRVWRPQGGAVLGLFIEHIVGPEPAVTAADALAILGDRVPVIGWDDSGPGGALLFPVTNDGLRLASLLRDQLNAALDEDSCPAESFPEPGAPAGYAGYNPGEDADFTEPPGGESARVAREEAAHAVHITEAGWGGWRPGDRFVAAPSDDACKTRCATYIWPGWGQDLAGHVIARCDVHHGGHDTGRGLLVDFDGATRQIVVAPDTLSACARKVTS
jgi:hypothetical protein